MMTDDDDELDSFKLFSLPVQLQLPGLCSQFSVKECPLELSLREYNFDIWYLISGQEKCISARNHNIFSKLCVFLNV